MKKFKKLLATSVLLGATVVGSVSAPAGAWKNCSNTYHVHNPGSSFSVIHYRSGSYIDGDGDTVRVWRQVYRGVDASYGSVTC